MKKYSLIVLSLMILVTVYVFQHFSYADLWNKVAPSSLEITAPNFIFIINKTTRLILNDFACILLIFSIFHNKIYLRAAFYLFLVELLIMLPVYFILKLNLEGDSELSSPLLSQIHRLIYNSSRTHRCVIFNFNFL